jgi:hypothetical protein
VPTVLTYYNAGAQQLVLTALVSSPHGGPVQEGVVQFQVLGHTLSSNVSGGHASAILGLPAGLAAGNYAIGTSYSDAAGNLTASTASGTLMVAQAQTSTTLTQLSVQPSFGGATVSLTALVNGPGGAVTTGTVTFNVGGYVVQAPISGGVATTSLSVPLTAVSGRLGVTATFSDPAGNLASSSQGQTSAFNAFNAFFPTSVTFNGDGSQVMTLDFFSLLLAFIYNSDGTLLSFFFAGA